MTSQSFGQSTRIMLNKVGTQQINYFNFSLLVLGARGNLIEINGKQLW